MFLDPGHDGDSQLQNRYEQLRWEGKQRAISRELVIFLTEGMFAWMQAWSSLPATTAGKGRPVDNSGLEMIKNNATHLIGIKKEIVNIIANMSLEKLKGDGRCKIC